MKKRYMSGGNVDDAGLEQYEKPKKSLPSENIKEDKPVTEKAVNAVKGLGKRLYENVMGTDEQNAAASERLKKAGKFAKGGSVSSASKRGDGCAQRGKTRGRMV